MTPPALGVAEAEAQRAALRARFGSRDGADDDGADVFAAYTAGVVYTHADKPQPGRAAARASRRAPADAADALAAESAASRRLRF